MVASLAVSSVAWSVEKLVARKAALMVEKKVAWSVVKMAVSSVALTAGT
jgi:hypothetical protein